MQIKLVIGDFSDDGHGKTETVIVETRHTAEQIIEAFQKGAEKLDLKTTYIKGWPLLNIDGLCSNYEDYKFPKDIAAKLGVTLSEDVYISAFWENKDINQEWNDFVAKDGKLEKYATLSYCAVWLAIALQGDPTIKMSVVQDTMPKINIGGYGLFN